MLRSRGVFACASSRTWCCGSFRTLVSALLRANFVALGTWRYWSASGVADLSKAPRLGFCGQGLGSEKCAQIVMVFVIFSFHSVISQRINRSQSRDADCILQEPVYYNAVIV